MVLSQQSYFLNIAQCTDCGGPLQIEAASIFCAHCSRIFAVSEGILDMRPLGSLPIPVPYDDPDYIKLQAFIPRMTNFTYNSKIALLIHDPGHRAIEKLSRSQASVTVDIGCGYAYHRHFIPTSNYYIGLDSDFSSLSEGQNKLPKDRTFLIFGCAERLPFRPAAVEKIVAIYTLEHFFYLDAALREVKRVLKKNGEFLVSIPTEGGLSWSLGRRILISIRFRDLDFDYFKAIKIEHCNNAKAVLAGVKKYFHIDKIRYFPFRVPVINMNLLISFRATPLGNMDL